MRSGQLRHLVELQHLGARVDDGAGGGSIPYVTYAEDVPAAIEPLEGRELLLAGQYDARLTHRVRLRYRPDVRPSDRVVYGDRVFNVKTPIDPEERHRELELMCEELVTW